MSTKCTIACSSSPEFNFHFYHEVLCEDEGPYLELRGQEVEYEAGPGWVRVHIPAEIWEVIRHLAPAAIKCAEWNDKQAVVRAKREADALIAVGSQEPRHKMVQEYIEHFRKLREEHRERKKRIEALLKEQR